MGLIYGPSGCGKSSLVKAGLLPRLGKHVLPVYIEATPEETEARLLKGLRKVCPELPRELGLVDSLARLRKGRVLPPSTRCCWSWTSSSNGCMPGEVRRTPNWSPPFGSAMASIVQAVVMVRDDFWMAATPVHAGPGDPTWSTEQNIGAVDLFDPRPCAKGADGVRARPTASLPEKDRSTSKRPERISGSSDLRLAQDGKIISVRLALFAEMVKGKPWAPATLKEVGGTEGVG